MIDSSSINSNSLNNVSDLNLKDKKYFIKINKFIKDHQSIFYKD